MSRQLATSARATSDKAPRYRALADTLAREIRSDYTPGELLPAEVALAQRFAVNRHTVRRALDELVAAGMVTRHQGRGTQVVDQRLDYSVSAGSKVTHNLAVLGIATQTECLAQGLQVPPEAIAQRFACGNGERLLCVDTLRCIDGAPLMLLRHWFDPQRVPDWESRYRGGSTRALLQQHYDLQLFRRRVRIESSSATRDDSRHLQCPLGAPLLQLSSDNVDRNDALVEVSISRARADRLAYHIDFDPTEEMLA